jgi:cytoskeletal protein CcmA (bactofilin family)
MPDTAQGLREEFSRIELGLGVALGKAGVRDSGEGLPSMINKDLSIVGNVTFKGELHIDGQIQGAVYCSSLVLGENSRLNGDVIAEDVIVRGGVTGSIKALRVTLQSKCHVEGEIFHQKLVIEQGAYFEGASRRSDNPLG